MQDRPGAPVTPNPGHCPREAAGKRVVVRLANGDVCGREPASAATPAGWPADGRQGCRWSRLGLPHDIADYEVVA